MKWVFRVAERVDALAKADPEYCELAQQQALLVSAFESLVERMNPVDRELLLDYMDVIGNMQYRFSQLDWL